MANFFLRPFRRFVFDSTEHRLWKEQLAPVFYHTARTATNRKHIETIADCDNRRPNSLELVSMLTPYYFMGIVIYFAQANSLQADLSGRLFAYGGEQVGFSYRKWRSLFENRLSMLDEPSDSLGLIVYSLEQGFKMARRWFERSDQRADVAFTATMLQWTKIDAVQPIDSALLAEELKELIDSDD